MSEKYNTITEFLKDKVSECDEICHSNSHIFDPTHTFSCDDIDEIIIQAYELGIEHERRI